MEILHSMESQRLSQPFTREAPLARNWIETHVHENGYVPLFQAGHKVFDLLPLVTDSDDARLVSPHESSFARAGVARNSELQLPRVGIEEDHRMSSSSTYKSSCKAKQMS